MADITFQQLLLGTQRVLPTAIAHKDQNMRIFNTRITNFAGTKMKVFTTNVMSSIGRKSYNVNLAFYNIEDPENTIPSLTEGRVGVRCSCSSYYFWFSWANTKAKANYGSRFRRYIRKTPPPPEGYPYKNPLDIPGVCKHIIHFVESLRAEGLIQ